MIRKFAAIRLRVIPSLVLIAILTASRNRSRPTNPSRSAT